MTETTCPTCGGRCEVSEGRCLRDCDYHCAKLHALNYQALSTSDLTKLREAWKDWGLDKGLNVDLFIIGDKEMDIGMRKSILQAVKELLGENK